MPRGKKNIHRMCCRPFLIKVMSLVVRGMWMLVQSIHKHGHAGTQTHIWVRGLFISLLPLLDHHVFCFQVSSLVPFWVPKSAFLKASIFFNPGFCLIDSEHFSQNMFSSYCSTETFPKVQNPKCLGCCWIIIYIFNPLWNKSEQFT